MGTREKDEFGWEYMCIDVTQEHIDDGLESDCQRCAVALALKERFGDLAWVCVGTGKAEVIFDDVVDGALVRESYDFTIETNVREFIKDFDSGNDVSPIRIQMPYARETVIPVEDPSELGA